ncbi:uncharacterized protein [Euphorbia lathyris]|uniref:uncharacterized protein isoform X3 n=1 Tax=Euphorbia lathyris TaxID=212925 RepID=UPI0033131D9C
MSDDGTTQGSPKRKKTRGPSMGLKHKPNVIRELEWDEFNRPFGKFASEYSSYIRVICRGKVPVRYKKWNQVPKGLKDTLWEDIQREFCLPNDHRKKSVVLRTCNEAWRRWKYTLNRKFIRIKKASNKTMPYQDGRMSKEDFDLYAKYVNTDGFKAISDKAKVSKSYDEHPHYMGRASYAQNEVRWRKKGLYSLLSGEESSNGVASGLLLRGQNWILGRSKIDKDGNLIVPNEKTRQVKEKYDHWEQKKKDGEFVPNRSDDILSRSTERHEHSGRVRGIGGMVGHRTVFGPCSKTGGMTRDQYIDVMVKLDPQKQTQSEFMREQFKKMLEEMGIQIPSQSDAPDCFRPLDGASPTPVDSLPVDRASPALGKSSCHSGGIDPFVDIQVPKQCQVLLLVEGERVVVAHGVIHPEMKVNHGMTINPENVVVNIDDYENDYGDIPVPVPSEHIQILGEASGSFTQWPKNLILLLGDKASCSKGDTSKKKHDQSANESVIQKKKLDLNEVALPKLTKKCNYMRRMLDENPTHDMFEMLDDHVFGSEEEIKIFIGREDVDQLLHGEWLSTSVLEVFITGLKTMHNRHLDSVGFMCSHLISSTTINSKQEVRCRKYMIDALIKYKGKRLILCPYHDSSQVGPIFVQLQSVTFLIKGGYSMFVY